MFVISDKNLESLLGKPKFSHDQLYENETPVGVTTGLAYNSLGGSLIFIETVVLHQNGSQLKTTGKLGKVMQESTQIAHSYARKFISELDSKNTFLEQVRANLFFQKKKYSISNMFFLFICRPLYISTFLKVQHQKMARLRELQL